MDQKTTFEQASERLRQALPLMARNRVPIVPPNYAVWYEYVAGSNAALSEALDRILSAGEAVDEAATLQLYRQYFDGADASRAEAAQRTVKKLIEALTESVETAGSEVHRYGQSLQDCAAQLSDDMGAEEVPRQFRLPLIGTIDPGALSLPALTIVLVGILPVILLSLAIARSRPGSRPEAGRAPSRIGRATRRAPSAVSGSAAP